MLNKIFLMGRLTRDPELRRTQSGTAVTSFSLAVDRDFKGQNGEKETDFIDVVAWRNTAEFVSKYFTKGRMAIVEGRLQTATAISAAQPKLSPTMYISATPSGIPLTAAILPLLLTVPLSAADTPLPQAVIPNSPRSAKKTANCRSEIDSLSA